MRQGEAVELEIPSSPEYVAIVRRAVEGVALHMHFDPDSIEDLKLAVGEACNNAVGHGCPDEYDTVAIRCLIVADGLMVEVRNNVSDCEFPQAPVAPDLQSECGRGLYMIRELVDEVDIRWESDTAVVKMLKRLHTRLA